MHNQPAGLEWGLKFGAAHDASAQKFTDAIFQARAEGNARIAAECEYYAAKHIDEAQAWYTTVDLLCRLMT